MGMNRTVRDTLLSLQRAQLERERRHKTDERLTARRVVEAHGKENDWPEEDVLMVIQILGLV